MSFSISYLQRAIKEYEVATQWYRAHSVPAAINFEIAVKEKIDLLVLTPEAIKIRTKNSMKLR